ncbi:MAG: leucyl aminopeptidase [Bdellovibrionota bacterium]
MTPLKAEIRFKKITSLSKHSGNGTLVVGLVQDIKADNTPQLLSALRKGKEFGSFVDSLKKFPRFKASSGEGLALYQQASGLLKDFSSYEDVLLFGLGKLERPSLQEALVLGAKLGQELKNNKITSAEIFVDSFLPSATGPSLDFAGRPNLAGKIEKEDFLEKILVGLHLGLYTFDNYKSKKSDVKVIDLNLLSIAISDADARKILDRVKIAVESTYIARDLMNTPSNDLRPNDLAKRAQELGKKAGFKTTVWDEKKLAAEGMNGIIAVGRGSDAPPRLIIMEHNGAKKGVPTLVLVGKGITFDSGGISIKPAAGMEYMKMDMGGSAAVIAALYGIAKSKTPIRVIGIVASAENMVNGDATRPGDIYKAYGGKTVEVLNTDAEGRLVLADALEFAKSFKPDAVVDVATLTGAVMVALGGACSGIMGNNAALIRAFHEASAAQGERTWELPLFEVYADDMRSKIADLQNIGSSRNAGSQKGGAFLHAFVESSYPWLHVDIAGVMDATKEQGAHCPGGGTGMPTRSLIELANNFKEHFKA